MLCSRAFTAICAASDSLARLCVTEPVAIQVLGDLDAPISVKWSDEHSLALAHRLEVLRIAARDLLGIDSLEEVTKALSESASFVLDASLELATDGSATREHSGGPCEIAIIGMGKLGGGAAQLLERCGPSVRHLTIS